MVVVVVYSYLEGGIEVHSDGVKPRPSSDVSGIIRDRIYSTGGEGTDGTRVGLVKWAGTSPCFLRWLCVALKIVQVPL